MPSGNFVMPDSRGDKEGVAAIVLHSQQWTSSNVFAWYVNARLKSSHMIVVYNHTPVDFLLEQIKLLSSLFLASPCSHSLWLLQ